MRKTVYLLLGVVSVFLCYFTLVSAGKAFDSDWRLPASSGQEEAKYRLVLITQELETPFWDKVGKGALEEAEKEGISLEIWGSYSKNHEDFLKKLEIAIHSKVDGIIVQGLDTDEFKALTKIKAAFYGIPVVTVANDVPMAESLRRTYVGSNQYLAGQMVARQLVADMGRTGKVILMSDTRQEYYQKQRLSGVQDVLKGYPNIETLFAETPDTRERVIATTQDVMNREPDVDAFIAVNANIAGAMVQEIGRRAQVEPYYIYSFDDGKESLALLEEGKLDGLIEQSPEQMGKTSVSLIVKWLSGESGPLNMDGYLTEVRMLKEMDTR